MYSRASSGISASCPSIQRNVCKNRVHEIAWPPIIVRRVEPISSGSCEMGWSSTSRLATARLKSSCGPASANMGPESAAMGAVYCGPSHTPDESLNPCRPLGHPTILCFSERACKLQPSGGVAALCIGQMEFTKARWAMSSCIEIPQTTQLRMFLGHVCRLSGMPVCTEDIHTQQLHPTCEYHSDQGR